MTTELILRSFSAELEVRAKGDGRTIYGIAVPYDHPQRISTKLTEQFARGAFDHQLDRPERVKFKREHQALIGKATLLRDDTAGLYTEFRVSNTERGDETLELVRDGVLTDLSVGFREGKNRKLPGGTVERTAVDLREVSIVEQGAYGDAAFVGGVRSAGSEDETECPYCSGKKVSNMSRSEQILASLPILSAG